MKKSLFIFSILCLFLVVGLVSASGSNVKPQDINGNVTSQNPGSDFEVKFKLNNTFDKDFENIVLTVSGDILNAGIVESIKINGVSLDVSSNSASLGSRVIVAGEKSDEIAVKFSVKDNVSPGKYTGKIAIQGNYVGGSATSTEVILALNINSDSKLTLTKAKSLTKFENGSVVVTNNGNIDFNEVNLILGGNLPASLTTDTFSLDAGESRTVGVSPTNLNSLIFGDNTLDIRAIAGDVQSETVSFLIREGFCSYGSVGNNLSLSNIDLSNDGDDDETWMPLDTISVDVDVENNGNDDITDVYVEIALYDSQGKNRINDVDFLSQDDEKYKIGKIRDDDKESHTFEFQIPADMDEGNYKLAVKAYSKDTGENVDCADTADDFDNGVYQSIEVEKETDEGKYIAFDNVVLSPSEATCGDVVTLSFTAYNIGDEDQDQIKINVYSNELKIDQEQELKKNFDQGDNEDFEFNFVVPQNLEDKSYRIQISSEYDYRNGVYREKSDDSYNLLFKVFGCSVSTVLENKVNPIQSAKLNSDAVAGESLEISVLIMNPTSEEKTYLIGANGYESWSNLESISKRLVTLEPGKSQEVTFSFNTDKDVSNEESFEVEVTEGTNTYTQEVAVQFDKATSGNLFGDNSLIWIIGIVNVLLILIIIIVAVRFSRK